MLGFWTEPIVAEFTSSACSEGRESRPPLVVSPGEGAKPFLPSNIQKNAYLAIDRRRTMVNPSQTRNVCAYRDNILTDLVVRRFANPNCPIDKRVTGSEIGLTGWTIIGNPQVGEVIDACTWVTPSVRSEKSNLTNWSTMWPAYLVHQSPRIYTATCGGPEGRANATRVNVTKTPGTGLGDPEFWYANRTYVPQ